MTTPKNNTEENSGLASHPNMGNKRGSVYEVITERIISMLEKGTVPWQNRGKSPLACPAIWSAKSHIAA